MTDPPSARRWLPRFTLLNALFALTIAALAAGLYQARRNNLELQDRFAPLRAENEKLRAETGALTIEDPDKVYAIQLPDQPRGVARYRVYLPEGPRYYLAAQANGLPMEGELPTYGPPHPALNTTLGGRSERGGAQTANGCSAGEFLITVTMGRNDRGEKYLDASMQPQTEGAEGARIGFTIRSEPDEWPAVELRKPDRRHSSLGAFTTGVGQHRQTEITPVTGSIVLFERRYMHGEVTSSADSDEGVIVWIGVVNDAVE